MSEKEIDPMQKYRDILFALNTTRPQELHDPWTIRPLKTIGQSEQFDLANTKAAIAYTKAGIWEKISFGSETPHFFIPGQTEETFEDLETFITYTFPYILLDGIAKQGEGAAKKAMGKSTVAFNHSGNQNATVYTLGKDNDNRRFLYDFEGLSQYQVPISLHIHGKVQSGHELRALYELHVEYNRQDIRNSQIDISLLSYHSVGANWTDGVAGWVLRNHYRNLSDDHMSSENLAKTLRGLSRGITPS